MIIEKWDVFERYFLLTLLSVILFSACQNTPKQEEQTGKLKRYELKGKVISVDKENKKASVAHEEIPGFMSAMTMDFTIKEDWVLNELKSGSEIKAELVVDNLNAKSWLEKVIIISAPSSNVPQPIVKEKVAVKGKKIIDFTLINQNNQKVTPKNFEGKTWALTFIYSQCPLPDFCIAMSKNFSDVANKISESEDDSLKEHIRLLTISFDPERDNPERLTQYGLGYLGKNSKAKDFKIWQLAVGKNEEIKKIADFFGLRYEVDKKDKTQFIHSLRTAVISSDGKIHKVISGNRWTSDSLMNELKRVHGSSL